MFCRKCGEELLEDSLWCTNCGAEVVKVAQQKKETEDKAVDDTPKKDTSNLNNSSIVIEAKKKEEIYQKARNYSFDGNYAEALELFSQIPEYKDSKSLGTEAMHKQTLILMNNNPTKEGLEQARKYLLQLDNLLDRDELLEKCNSKLSMYGGCSSSISQGGTDGNYVESSSSYADYSTVKLSAGPCILGFFLCGLIFSVLRMMLNDSMRQGNTTYFICVFFAIITLLIFCISYCFVGVANASDKMYFRIQYNAKKNVYKLNKSISDVDQEELKESKQNLEKHKKLNSFLISFFNGFFGGIWGLLFNYNLNQKKKGYSQYIVGSIYVLVVLFLLFMYWYLILLCIQDCSQTGHWEFIFFIVIYIALILSLVPKCCGRDS